MTTLLMILVAIAIGFGVGLMDPGKPKGKGHIRKAPRRKDDDDFWDYAWS